MKVSDGAGLASAISNSSCATIQLTDSIALTEGVVIPAGRNVTLELNGKVLSCVYAGDNTFALIKNEGALVIQDSVGDGKITSHATKPDGQSIPGYASNAISNNGHLTIKSGTIECTTVGAPACYAIDNYGGSTMIMQGGVIKQAAGKVAVRVFAGSNKATIRVDNGTIEGSRAIWIQLPGSANAVKPVEVDINGGTLTSTDISDTGAYDTDWWYQAIYSSSFGDDYSGVNIDISGGTINGDVTVGGGSANGGSGAETVNISGGTFNGIYGVFTYNSKTDDKISVSGGVFKESAYNDVNSYKAEGSKIVVENGLCEVVPDSEVAVAAVDGRGYMSFTDAMQAVKDGSVVELYKPVTLTEQLQINNDITINGNGNTISSSTVQRMIWIFADVTINDLTVENTMAGGRCIETRAGGLTLNLNNVVLNATNASGTNNQVLTVGGDAVTAENRVKVNLDGCSIDAGATGYGIVTFNPTDLLIKNSTSAGGYGAIYLKPATSSVGSAGTIVTVEGSTLKSDDSNDGYDFGAIVVESNDITINMDADSKLIATSGEDKQYAIVFSQWITTSPYVAGADYTGLNATINGEIDADYFVYNLKNTNNKIVISDDYKAAIENEGHIAVEIGNGMISVWAEHAHTYTNKVDEAYFVSGANCTDTAVYKESCSICGAAGTKTFTVGEAAGHIWDEGKVTTAPTCTSTGVKTYTCQVTNCGQTKTEELPMVAHTLTKVDAKAATCTAAGNIEHYACSVCQKLFNNDKAEKELTASEIAVAITDHKLTKVEAKAATCTAAGNIEHYTCSACQKLFNNDKVEKELTASEIVVAAVGHKLTKIEAKEASYTAAGNVEYYVCACGALFADAEGKTTTTAEAVVIPQLIKIEQNTAKVESSAVDAAIEEAVNDSAESGTTTEETKLEVVIKVEDAKTEENKEEVAKVEQIELPVEALDKVAEKEADLVVVLPAATVTVNTEALEAVSKQAEGEKVSLVIKEVKTETLTVAQQQTVEKFEVAVTITAEFICQKTGEKIWTEDANKTEKTGNIKVELPFTPAEGTKGSDYTVVYVDNNGKAKKIETQFVDGHLVFELEHFSDYIVINETKTPLVVTPETGDDANLVLLCSVMILAAVGMVSMAVLGKKAKYVK